MGNEHENQPLLKDPTPTYPPAPGYQAQPPMHANHPPEGHRMNPIPTIFPENPIRVQCTFCRKEVITRINYKSGGLTFILAGGLCLIGLWCCAWIPCVIDAGKDVEHYCPACNNLLGIR